MAYKTKNTRFEARFLWFMAYRSRNINPEARFLLIMAYGTRRYITFKGRLFSFVACKTRILHLSRASSDFLLIERRISQMKRPPLFLFEMGLFWYKAYRTRNITFKARLFLYMALRTRNATFEARLF